MADKEIELFYFDAKSRGEVARLLLTAAGKRFKDIRIQEADWPTIYQAISPFGQVPFIKLDGEIYGQSLAINAYLAKEFGFYGKTNLESLQIDQVCFLVEDLMRQCVHVPHIETEEGQKKEKDKTKLEISPKFLGNLERLLKDNKTGYFVEDRLTLADIAVFDLATGMLWEYVDINDSYPLLRKNLETVRAHSRIGPYMLARPITSF
jgi:glutathione S-transferase